MKNYIFEAIGTFILLFVTCMGAITLGNVNFIIVAISYAVCYYVLFQLFNKVSGCHLNPVVTLGCLFTKKINTKKAMLYILAQFIAAIFVSILVLIMVLQLKTDLSISSLIPSFNNSLLGVSITCFFIFVIFISLIISFVFLSFTLNKKFSKYSGIFISLAYFLITLISVNIVGCFCNPFAYLSIWFVNAIFSFSIMSLIALLIFLFGSFLGAFFGSMLFSVYDKKIIKGNSSNKKQ